MQHIEQLDETRITEIEIPNATPIVYEFDNNLQVVNKQVLYN